MSSSMTDSIGRVITSAVTKYNDIMESDYVGKNMKIDGVPTRGQMEEVSHKNTIEDEYSRTVTCKLDVSPHRGSKIEIMNNDGTGYDSGIVTTIPNKTPVDYYFSVLLFNTVAKRYRKQFMYSEDGYVIGNNPLIEDSIPCFVQRIGMRQRQIDVGIDRNAVNEITTLKKWDIQKGDILHIGSDKYKITDLKELDDEICQGYMTYYRE